MPQQPVNLLGGFYADDSLPWSVQDTVNYIPEVSQAEGTRTPTKLRGAPGLRPWVNIGDAPIRVGGSHNCEGKLFVVSGSTLYQISNAGVAIPLGTIPGVGPVSMSHNQITGGNEILIGTGTPNGYVYNTQSTVFQKITDEGYPGTGSIDYIDSYLAQVEPFGRFWFHSDLADALSYNTLDRYESEADPDAIVGLTVTQFEVFVLNRETCEFFGDTGASTGTFQSKRAMIQTGCAGRNTIAKLDNSVLWLDNKGVVNRLNGYQAQPISNPPIEKAIASCNWANAFAFTYESQSHKIYYLTFPDGHTWGYDVTTQLWHRRQSFELNRWRLNTLTYWNGQWIGGDFQSGLLYVLDWDYMLEADQPLVSERISGVVHGNQSRVGIPCAELIFDTGHDATVAVVAPPQPEPPTITGDAPDGVVNASWGPYSYTLGGGTPPYTVTARPGGTPPTGIGPITAAGTFPVATPTVVESNTFTLRNTDSNGLFADLTDTITISSGPMLALGESSAVSGQRLISSYSGQTWSALITPDANLGAGSGTICGALAGRFVAYGHGDSFVRYSDNLGVNWTIVATPSALSAQGRVVALTGVSLLGALSGVFRTTTNFASFTTVIPGTEIWYIAGHDALVVALDSTTRPTKSTDKGATWSAFGTRLDTYPTNPLSFQRCAASDGTTIIFGGDTVDSGTGPSIAVTTDGLTFTTRLVAAVPGRLITAICAGPLDSNGKRIWVAGCNDGKFYRSIDPLVSWSLMTTDLGTAVVDIVYNGTRFIAAGSPTAPTAIKTLEGQATTWVTATQLLAYKIKSIALSGG